MSDYKDHHTEAKPTQTHLNHRNLECKKNKHKQENFPANDSDTKKLSTSSVDLSRMGVIPFGGRRSYGRCVPSSSSVCPFIRLGCKTTGLTS